jgi:hypothetical protein
MSSGKSFWNGVKVALFPIGMGLLFAALCLVLILIQQ